MKKKSNAAQRGSDIASNRFPVWKKATLASAVALTTLGISLDAQALALGAITVRSSLGEPLRAEIEVPQISSEEASSFQARIASQQAFRSVGVDYTAALTGARLSLERRANGQAYLRLTGERPINEPFLGIVIEANWANGRMVRDYTMLVDPPSRPQAAAPVTPVPAPQTQSPAGPQVLQAPPPAPGTRPSVAEQTTPGTASAARAAQRARAAEAVQARNSAAGGGGQVTVRRGDTAYGLASANLPAGVSLDQMLMAMLRANPGAFIRGNVNYMKAGVVLDMPNAEQASSIPRSEARQAVVAQSRDFREFRRGLAQSAPAAQVEAAGRSASGRVSASVRDGAPAPATPDRLTISKGAAGAASSPGAAETGAARTRQAQEQADRIAELNRNIAELSRLQGTAVPAPAPSTAPATAATPAAPTTPSAGGTAQAPSINVPVGASPAASAAATSAATTAAAAAASTTAANASIQAASSAEAAAVTASTAAAATAAAAASSAPKPAPKPPAPRPAPPLVEEPSLLDSLTENPMLPLAGGGLLALLLGYGLYRSRRKKEADGQFDSTLTESRPQGDSFFGSSGGRRVDTTNRTSHMGNQSSMIYSPSQIDAAGDVDPVAEADVYLAYGRDMQAEEILKEALRVNPTRLSIHRKLAEIYLKRRDARALEAIATEAHAISGGTGGDWAYIRGLGSQIDADNPLYASESNLLAADDAEIPRRAFGTDTGPMPTRLIDEKSGLPSSFSALDLDLESAPVKANDAQPAKTSSARSVPPEAPPAMGTTAAVTGAAAAAAAVAAAAPKQPDSKSADLLVSPISVMPPLDFDLDLDIAAAAEFASSEPMTLDTPKAYPTPSSLSVPPPPAPVDTGNSGMIEFDLEALSMDPESRSPGEPSTEQPDSADDLDDNPLSTKMALAQEFHAIGDTEGARSLIKEVVAEASGPLKARAERFLNELS
ncbi:FimV/HubP family polar landmark protein [Ottowia thiooxydans]|uniref:Pilus assembly protein FimV n=1 Tax=Ottowia thiooxydans TaxID=219182 RepID=A0ABV2Q3Q1_9BURK